MAPYGSKKDPCLGFYGMSLRLCLFRYAEGKGRDLMELLGRLEHCRWKRRLVWGVGIVLGL